MLPEYDLVIGKYPNGDFRYFGGGEHTVLHARSGAGKSVGFSIPNAFTWPGSLVCLDIKRELFQHTAGYRASLPGHEVYLFDPASIDGRSHRWNPFWQVDRTSLDRFDSIARMAFQLWPEALDKGDKNANYWQGVAREAFSAFANFVAETPSIPMTMTSIYDLFMMSGAADVRIRGHIESAQKTDQPYTQRVVRSIEGHLRKPEKIRGEIDSTVTSALQVWSNPRIEAATSATDFDLRDIRRKRMSIYVGVSPGDIQRNAPLLRLFFDALLNVNTTATPEQDETLIIPTLVMLDEFVQLGRMDRLAHALQYARGYGLRFALVVQNRAQIMDVYGTNAATDVFDNVGCEMMYGTGDEKLAKQFEERMGDRTVDVTTHTRQSWFGMLQPSKQHDAHHPNRRALMLRQEILQMPQDEMLILRPGMKPMKAKKIRWWKEQELQRRRAAPPEIPELTVRIAMDGTQVSGTKTAVLAGAEK